MAKADTAAGSLLSLRSNAVCIVSLLQNTSCRCHWKPEYDVKFSVDNTEQRLS